MTKGELAALEVARAHLDPSDAGFSGSDEVRAMLLDDRLRLYISSWVLSRIDAVIAPPGDLERRATLFYASRDYARVRAARKERK